MSSHLLGKLKQDFEIKQCSDVLFQHQRQKEVLGGGWVGAVEVCGTGSVGVVGVWEGASVGPVLAPQASGPEFGSLELM